LRTYDGDLRKVDGVLDLQGATLISSLGSVLGRIVLRLW
jgi:hypothetical protein